MKVLKRISVLLFSIFLCFCLAFQVSAATEYEYEGYSYTFINNYNISLSGWDNRSPELVIPNEIYGRNVISVANYACVNNEGITAVDFSQANNLNRIGMGAFQGCNNISQEIVLPESVTTINDCAFQDCSSIPALIDNSQSSEIPDQGFYNCSALRSVVLNENLQRIGYYAFANCTLLEYVAIPKSVQSIGVSSFMNDPNLTLGVWYDSYGYLYAKAQSIPYILLDEFKLGDIDGDGFVNINDVTTIQRHLAELEELNDLQILAADTNQDGIVDIADATALQMYLAEYDITYPIGEVMTQ